MKPSRNLWMQRYYAQSEWAAETAPSKQRGSSKHSQPSNGNSPAQKGTLSRASHRAGCRIDKCPPASDTQLFGHGPGQCAAATLYDVGNYPLKGAAHRSAATP